MQRNGLNSGSWTSNGDHSDGKIFSGDEKTNSSNGGKTGTSGSLMTYARTRCFTSEEISKVIAPAIGLANKKKNQNTVTVDMHFYGNNADYSIIKSKK
ncbi:MAG: hypothetical protein RLZZ628_587 [Bacteroidota bacterium]